MAQTARDAAIHKMAVEVICDADLVAAIRDLIGDELIGSFTLADVYPEMPERPQICPRCKCERLHLSLRTDDTGQYRRTWVCRTCDHIATWED